MYINIMRYIYADCEWNPYDLNRDVLVVAIHNQDIRKFYSFIEFFEYCNTEPTAVVGYCFSAWMHYNGNRIGDVNRFIDAYGITMQYRIEHVNRKRWNVYDHIPNYPYIYLLDVALLLIKRYPSNSGYPRSLNFWCSYLDLPSKDEVTLDEIRDYFTKSENRGKIELYCTKDVQLVKSIFERLTCF